MRRICLLIHRWLAIPFGLFFAIACFTGALLLWKNEVAALMGQDAGTSDFFRGVTRFHRWLFMPPANPHGGMSTGRLVMGMTAIAATLILLTGVAVWWPRSLRQLKSRLAVHIGRGFRRFIYDSHVSLGIYATVFLLLMSLTGPVWSFSGYRRAAVALIGGSETRSSGHGRPAQVPPAARSIGGQHQGKGRPAGEQRAAAPAQAGSHAAQAHGQRGANSPQRTFIYLHTGKWGGTAGQVIYTLATVVGGFLPISGYWLWWVRRRRLVCRR